MAPRTTHGITLLRTLGAFAEREHPAALQRALAEHVNAVAQRVAPSRGRQHVQALDSDANRVVRATLQAQGQLTQEMRSLIITTREQTAAASVEGTLAMWRRYERREPPGVDSQRLAWHVARHRTASPELPGRDEVLRNWQLNAREAVRVAVREAMQRGASPRDLARVAEEATRAEEWKLTRIVRTETAHAFNAAQQETIVRIAQEHPDVRKRWTELVDDRTMRPLDKRVAADSLALHGQLAAPDGLFTMPAGIPAYAPSIAFPPNRPNDRAVVTPWRRGWGIPGWEYTGGRHKRWIT